MPHLNTPQPGRRIAVIGTSGAGKTYVAKRLAENFGLTYICSDAIFWGPDWTMTPPAQRFAEYDRTTQAQSWTFDGNVDGLSDHKGPLILSRADTLIWLDLPRHQILAQLLRRTLRRVWSKTPMWHNNRESWRLSFFSRDSILLWSMQTFAKRRQQYASLFRDPQHTHLTRVHLTSRRQIDAWIASLNNPIA